jgi:5'/3'-nucleotidase SurE
MRFCSALVALLPLTQAANIVLSNDDGWAEINIRQFYEALTSSGDEVVISAPAENKYGSGTNMLLSGRQAAELTELLNRLLDGHSNNSHGRMRVRFLSFR